MVSNGYVMLDVKFRQNASVGERFNMTTLYSIEGPPSEWKDEGSAVGANTLAAVVKNETYVYLAGTSRVGIRFLLRELWPGNATKAEEDISNKLGYDWKMGYDPSANEMIFVAFVSQSNRTLIYFKDGETLTDVEEPKKRLVTLLDSGPPKSITKIGETHQLLHLYPVPSAKSGHKNELYIIGPAPARNLTKLDIDDWEFGPNVTFKMSSYEFNDQIYWFILPETASEEVFPKFPVFVTKDFKKRYFLDIGTDM